MKQYNAATGKTEDVVAISNEKVPVGLEEVSVALPVEIRGKAREFLFTNTTNLALNGVFISSVYEGMSDEKVNGFVSPSHDGKLFIQESDDQVAWYTTFSTDVLVANLQPDTISSVVYNKALPFEQVLVSRYVRIVYVNGATAQTRFAISAYMSK